MKTSVCLAILGAILAYLPCGANAEERAYFLERCMQEDATSDARAACLRKIELTTYPRTAGIKSLDWNELLKRDCKANLPKKIPISEETAQVFCLKVKQKAKESPSGKLDQKAVDAAIDEARSEIYGTNGSLPKEKICTELPPSKLICDEDIYVLERTAIQNQVTGLKKSIRRMGYGDPGGVPGQKGEEKATEAK